MLEYWILKVRSLNQCSITPTLQYSIEVVIRMTTKLTKEEWFQRVQEAARRLNGQANKTPVMSSRTLNELTGAEVFLKCENYQRVGAFKFRGAFNAMSRLTEDQRKRGIITHSSGNHAQAVALVGRLLGVQTTVVMPKDAPVIKRDATKAYGANIVEYDS